MALLSLLSLDIQAQSIIGGQSAGLGDYPWMTELFFFEGEHLCGATLIHPEWVLTAGHCSFASTGDDFLMVANAPYYDMDNPQASAEILYHDAVVYHPDWDGENGPDMALFHLATPAVTQPVALISPDELEEITSGLPAVVMGWGASDPVMVSSTDSLQVADVVLFANDTCQALYSSSTNFNPFEYNTTGGLICAGYFQGTIQAGSGTGDSGGPLLYEVNGELKQIGVVYGGEEDVATAAFPGAYTSVLSNLDWINTTIENFNGPIGLSENILEHTSIHFDSYSSELNLMLDSRAHGKQFDLEIYDLSARLLQSRSFLSEAPQTQFPMDLHPGLYVVQIGIKDLGIQFGQLLYID